MDELYCNTAMEIEATSNIHGNSGSFVLCSQFERANPKIFELLDEIWCLIVIAIRTSTVVPLYVRCIVSTHFRLTV